MVNVDVDLGYPFCFRSGEITARFKVMTMKKRAINKVGFCR